MFEQQASVSGAWNYDCCGSETKVEVPQVNPNQSLERPTWCRESGRKPRPVFVSSMYDSLETNIPKDLMKFSDQPFAPDKQLFPTRESVCQYLEKYAEDVKPLISFKTQVSSIQLQSDSPGPDIWNVIYQGLETGDLQSALYDAVAVCTGHYTVPYLPYIAGIVKWDKAYPGIISHSKHYRRPALYTGKKVVIVGNAASGTDIAAQIGTVAKTPVLTSSRSESFLISAAGSKEDVPEIQEFISPSEAVRAVRFANGRVESSIDAVLFCTGYLYSFPFLSSLQTKIITDGCRVQNLYQHIFHAEHPSLAFLALPLRVIPFPLSEAQAAVMARVWSGRLQLPSLSVMREWEKNVIIKKGAGKLFHTLNFPEDVDYHNHLYDWAAQTDPVTGKMPHRWTEEERYIRGRFAAIKKAFADKGEHRHQIRTVEELGFDYYDWLKDEEARAQISL